jgi:hypothetical protein
MQRGMVGHAQIATQPNQAARKRGFHQGLPGWVDECT